MENTKGWIPPTFKQLQKKGALLSLCFNQSKFSPLFEVVGPLDQYNEILSLTAIVKKPNAENLIFNAELKKTTINGDNEVYLDTDFSFLCDQEGEYVLVFNLIWGYATESADSRGGKTFNIQAEAYFAVAPEEQISSFTIKDVIDRTLAVTPTRTANGVNKYAFRNNAEEYATEESPEFTFTGKHLFEVMLDIASYKKMFPALYKNEIYFRPFWNGVMLTSDDLPPPTKAVMCSAIDQYCTALDSYVENMVCINDTNVGTVVEPYENGYISARSNSGSEISETTSVIPTQSAIYQPISLNVGETDGVVVGDIQAYLYEQEDYEALSDTSAAYPYSKGYALKYTRFLPNYSELAHRIDSENEISAALKYPALANIVKAKTGETVGVSLKEYIRGLLGLSNGHSFAELLFQPTYIPVVNARVRQYKPMINAEDYEATLFYNQQSEVVDSEAFGEHVKGLVQKLGNHTEIRVYRFDRVDDVPTVGTLIDEKSVYNVAMTIFENYVNATICLVDYAELSTYIGVKNEIKTSDISTTKWCNRFINWEEFLVFTHEAYAGNTLSITKDALADIVSFTTAEPLTCAMFTSYAESGDSIVTAFAPIKHLALGNSIYFQWEMLDNFAVGYKSEKAPSGATSILSGTQYNRAQRAVRYCDMYGRAETFDFKLLKTGPTSDNSRFDISVDLNFKNEKCVVSLQKESGLYLGITVMLNVKSTADNLILTLNQYLIFDPTETKKEFGVDGNEVVVSSYKVEILTDTVSRKGAYMRRIAHEYPQKPYDLQFSPTPFFQLYDWLIKKNSAEALKFAAQYHFRQTWREFVIGSGMSNFCALVGGSCSQLQMFISALPINRFDRHVNLGDTYNYLVLDDLPTFTVDEENKRVEITLPSSVNDYIDVTKSWGLVGVDKNGNRQLIFGENKNVQNEAFLTTIYLVAMQKNNEPQARATWRMLLENDAESVEGCIEINGKIAYFDENYNLHIPRNAFVSITNIQAFTINLTLRSVRFNVDDSYEIIEVQGITLLSNETYTFTMKGDMTCRAWKKSTSSGNMGGIYV